MPIHIIIDSETKTIALAEPANILDFITEITAIMPKQKLEEYSLSQQYEVTPEVTKEDLYVLDMHNASTTIN